MKSSTNTGGDLDWISAFNSRLRTKPFEQFNLLLCENPDLAETRQRDLLKRLLLEEDHHTSAQHWWRYLEYCTIKFPDRKLQLQRLVNKALEFIDEKENQNNLQYVILHMASAQLKT